MSSLASVSRRLNTGFYSVGSQSQSNPKFWISCYSWFIDVANWSLRMN